MVPFAGIQFLAFETVQSKLVQKSVPSTLSPYWIPACAGAAAAVTATVATYPLDVLRTRIAGHLEAVPRYRDYSSAFQTILKIEGFRPGQDWSGAI